jgi:hypothetical protein
VNVRLISLANCPEEFSTEITRAANTQNRIEKRDFAALDPQQERLRRELSLEASKIYIYKSGETLGNLSDGCTIEEATVALACANPDLALAVQAKREVGKLWEDVTKAPYKVLFNERLSALRMWRLVEVIREVEQSLKKEQISRTGRDRMIVVHGNRFILHHVYRLVDQSQFDEPRFDMPAFLRSVPSLTTTCADAVINGVQNLFPYAYITSLFKNATKCRQISTDCLASLKPGG